MSTPVAVHEHVAAIGQINGRIQWTAGQIPSGVFKIRPAKITVVPPSNPGEFGSTQVDFLKPDPDTDVTFGAVLNVGGVLSRTYSVSKLPLGVGIQLVISSPDGGQFFRTGEPVAVSLELLNSVFNGFDFVFVPVS